MDEFIRPKPLCLIIISGLHVDYLSDSKANNLKNLVNNYPYLSLSSSRSNINEFYKGYIELGSGNNIEEKSEISLSRVISDAGLTQLHLADTESYAYLSYFFNNQNKSKHDKEDWFKSPSLEFDFNMDNVDTVHSKLTKKIIKEVNKQYYDFIVVNYNDLLVNSDKVKALNELDKKIKDVIDSVLSFNGAVLITSNSGLLELENKVPLFLVSKPWKNKSFVNHDYRKKISEQIVSGDITQISPTILKILGLSKSRQMKSNSLI
jgi:2,3-bisphosphoglycerate-independent phosphoglycerate mutase